MEDTDVTETEAHAQYWIEMNIVIRQRDVHLENNRLVHTDDDGDGDGSGQRQTKLNSRLLSIHSIRLR
ncbi:hypothetical protein BLOT_010218 [Blomia tropicalis]|nr:hypothetical protein BLOT_010218 [Blomia tropicalis]